MSEIVRPPQKYPKGHCANVLRFHPDHKAAIARLKTTHECRAWLSKLNEVDADPDLKRAVSQRYQELE